MADLKAFTPTIKAAEADGTVSFVVARLGDHIDEDGDVTLPGYFGRQAVQLIPTHDWNHVPIGKGVIHEVGAEAVVDAKFNLAIPAARDWHAAIKFDFENPPALQEYSYGYTVLPGGSRPGEMRGRTVRFLQPLKDGSPGCIVHECSPVLLGAAGHGVSRTLAAKRRDDPAVAREYARSDALLAQETDRELARAKALLAPLDGDGSALKEYLRYVANCAGVALVDVEHEYLRFLRWAHR